MMYSFLANNRDDLIERCKAKVARRPTREATAEQLKNISIFLEQLEQASGPRKAGRLSKAKDLRVRGWWGQCALRKWG